MSIDGVSKVRDAGWSGPGVVRWLRVTEWGPQVLIFWCVALAYLPATPAEPRRYLGEAGLVSAWSVCLLLGGYLLNSFFDRRADTYKPGFVPFPEKLVPYVLTLAVLATAGGLTAAHLLSSNRWQHLLAWVQAIGLTGYSVPVIRVKERGAAGLLAAAVLQRMPTFGMQVVAFPIHRPAVAAAFALWLLVLGLIAIVEHQIEDCEADRRAGVSTWCRDVGWARAVRIVDHLYRGFSLVTAVAVGALALTTPAPGSLLGGALLVATSLVLVRLARSRYAARRGRANA